MSNLSTATPRVGLHGDSNYQFWTQDTEQGGDTPDVNRPSDQDVPDFGTEVPDVANDPAAPPFTGEDLEGPVKRRRRKRPQDEPNN
jgi:hypothetical protein